MRHGFGDGVHSRSALQTVGQPRFKAAKCRDQLYQGQKRRRDRIVPKSNVLLKVQCFGNFDVFTPNGEHVRFERSKAKEMFAYLVMKNGSSCTSRELFAILFEDEPYDEKKQNLMQSYNAFAVNTKVLDCDYYKFKELDAGAVNSFQNEFMAQYSRADFLYDDDFAR